MSNYSAALQNLNDETWKGLQVDEKLAVLQAIEKETAMREGRQPCQVVGEFIPSGEDGITLGYYNRGTRLITINTEQLSPLGKFGNDYERLVNTILHEGRHAYQHQAVAGEIEHDDKEELAAWSDNMQPGHYITYERNPRGYFNQPIERDARSFAEERLRVLEADKSQLFANQEEGGMRLVRDEKTLREAGMRNIEDILEVRRDDLRDKGMQDGPEMEALIERERVELQMEFERDAFGSSQRQAEARAQIDEQEIGISEEKDGSTERAEVDEQLEAGHDTGVDNDDSPGEGQERGAGISY